MIVSEENLNRSEFRNLITGHLYFIRAEINII